MSNRSKFKLFWHQRRNRPGTEGRVFPYLFHREIFADLPGKKGQGKGENEGKFEREEVETEIWDLPKNGQFVPGKVIFHAGKKSGKLTLPPLKDIPLTPLSGTLPRGQR